MYENICMRNEKCKVIFEIGVYKLSRKLLLRVMGNFFCIRLSLCTLSEISDCVEN